MEMHKKAIEIVKKPTIDHLPILISHPFTWFVLYHINKNNSSGTIELAKIIKIAPKNLIHKLKQFEYWGWIQKEKKKMKPKGWQRIYKITPSGLRIMEKSIDIQTFVWKMILTKCKIPYRKLTKKFIKDCILKTFI